MKHRKLVFLLLILITQTNFILAQHGTVTGKVTDKNNGQPIAGAVLSDAAGIELGRTSGDGSFIVAMNGGKQMLFIDVTDYEQYILSITIITGETVQAGTIAMSPLEGFLMDLSSLSSAEGINDDGFETQSVQGILSSSADIFQSTAAYTFGPVMFRTRGYESSYTNVSLNGFVVNDIESGSPYFSNWGGLNDVMRNAMVSSGPEPIGFLFEPVGGATRINTRASEYRSGLKAVYSLSNRTYRNRAMITYSTGMMENNWAITGSYSHRWSERGYKEGTFYNANSFFLSVEKKINSQHSLNLTALDAIYRRGVAGGSTQEVYDIMNDNYYNPYWGYQNGKVRNSRVRSNNKPLITLNHTWLPSDKLDIQTTAGAWFGKSGYTALNWCDKYDPRPDYYKNLPSIKETEEEIADKILDWQTDPKISHINWDQLYFANRNNIDMIEDVDGISGNNVFGHRSLYIVEDRRNDLVQFQLNSRASWDYTDNINITGGILVDIYRGHNFNTLYDLLGGDFWLDVDQYAERDHGVSNDSINNDLNNPNNLAYVGDIIGNNYYAFQRGATLWGTGRYSGNRYSAYLSANARYTSMWREGLFRKGIFPDNSFGESEKLRYLTWGIKAGGDYRITGRHMITLNTMIATNPPLFKNSFLSPRTRNTVTGDLQAETIISADISYILRTPTVKGRITGYYTRFMNQTELTSFYHDYYNTLVNYAMTNIDKENYGIEFGTEVALTSQLSVNAVASIGQFLWVNNPDITITKDNDNEVQSNDEVWITYFRQSGIPQTALALGIEYNSSKYWWAGITGSYYDNIYLDFNPVTRTKNEDGYYPYWDTQIKEPSSFLLDIFIGKSWKIDKTYINISANLSNVLNNTNMITGGYEQYRFDSENTDLFDPKVYYYNGFNYFINISIRR